jgi:hypothetical protein
LTLIIGVFYTLIGVLLSIISPYTEKKLTKIWKSVE